MRILKTGIYAEAGFSLFELIVVIFILSLFMGLVMPYLYGIGEGKLKAEAGKMASLLRYLNDSAVSRKEIFPIKFNLDAKLVVWNTNEGERKERFDSVKNVVAASTGNVSEGEVTLFFGPLGFQEHLLIIMKDRDKEMSVAFNPLSGRAKIVQSSKWEMQN